jgi:hypothetical protein
LPDHDNLYRADAARPFGNGCKNYLCEYRLYQRKKTTFISLYRDGVASPLSLLVSELAQNVDALDNIFHRLQNTGRLLPGHPLLVIDSTFAATNSQPFLEK